MKRFILSKSMLCLFLLGMVCNVAWAYTVTKATSTPLKDGYYVINGSCSHGSGWYWYNSSTTDRPFRVDTSAGLDLTNSVSSEQFAYVWKLTTNSDGSFSLLNMGSNIYLPADRERNKNMQQRTDAVGNFNLTETTTTGSWYMYQTNYTHSGEKLYVHCNKPSFLALSYWNDCKAGGSVVVTQFYEVDIPETTYTINFVMNGETIQTSSYVYPSDIALSNNLIKTLVPKGYYIVSTTLEGTTYTVNVVLDVRPVPGKKYYIFNKHQAGYQYYYDNNGSVGFAPACRYNDKAYIWLCEANGEKLNFKNVSTNKYFAWKALSNSAYGWNVSPEQGANKVVNEGCVTLQNGDKSKYLVGMIGNFDQADNAGYNTTTYSSDFCFVEYTHKPQPGKYYYFYNKHQKGDKYFYDNNGSVGFSATKDAFNKNYIWLCEEDANNPGMVTFKNLGTNKYFVWKGLSTTALAWTVDETVGNNKVVNEGCVTLTANQTGSNVLVVKNATGWDQSEKAGYYDETFSSDYCFEEFSVLPQDGMTYHIYNDNDTPLYLNNNNGTLKATEGKLLIDSHLFVCQKYGDNYRFKNLEGKWLAHKTLKDAAHNFKVTTENANNFGRATLWTDNVDSNGGRFLCIENNGSMSQAQTPYNKNSTNFSTDFVFELCLQTTKSLTINLPVYANATLTIDGTAYTSTLETTLTEGVAPTISVTTGNKHFEFAGFVDEEGNAYDIANLANATQDVVLTATFTPTFMSSVYGEKWVRFTNCSNTAYSAGLEVVNGGYADRKGKTAIMDFSAENQLWCLVGTAESFVLYNKAAGETYALNVPLAADASYAQNVESKMTTDKGSWKLKMGHYGVALVPTAKENASEWAINMYGGDGGYLKLFTTNKENKGSYWTVEKADVNNPVTLNVVVDKVWESSPRVAELTFTVNGKTSATRILGSVEGQALYLPLGATYEVSSMTYRGYTYNGCTESEGVLTASYTANDERTLFYSPRDGHPYRIPAIATAPNGDIFAICDYRPCGNDIGYGEVDLVCRVSSDNGVTWTEERTIADGLGHINDGIWKMGFGDPAIVADRESNKVLVMSVCGNRTCWDGNYGEGGENENPNRISRLYIEHDGEKWVYGQPKEVTYDIYPLFKNEGGEAYAASMFIGAGKICQSRVVKKGEYYRLYCAVWNVTKTQRQHHNYVIYSDDFGKTWNVLGDLGYENSASKWGNEPKVEELPDGTVVLSSRKYNGRYFNLFTFADDTYTTGSWMGEVGSNEVTGGLSFGGNSTNGEIYKVKAVHKESGRICDLMFQSIPTGNDRSNVAIYYKEMEYNVDGTNKYTSTTFAQNWTKGIHVSTKGSCYSTMISQADGRIAFFFEEEPSGYCMVYIPYSIEELTGGAYTLYSVTSTIGQYEIGTFYASEAMQIPEGVKAYVAEEKPVMDDKDADGIAEGTITMRELENLIPAKTGVVLRGAANNYTFMPSISYGTEVAGNMLKGWESNNVDSQLKSEVALPTDGSTNYVLTVMKEKAGFYKKDAAFNVYNNKAYLNVASKAGTIRLRFENNDGTTDIIEVPTEALNGNGEIYDLSGRRVEKATKGVFIVNGKKVIF